MIFYDERWSGPHGIGRFSRELAARIPHTDLVIGGRPMSALDPLRLSIALRRVRSEGVFLSPGYNAPLFCKQRFVFTIHDLNHIDRPENSSVLKRLYYATVLKSGCARASKLFTVSEFARRRILEWSGVPGERVVNVGNGVGSEFIPGGPRPVDVRPYFLCVSNRRPHKNEARVVEAFAIAALPAEVELVLTGSATDQLEAHIVDVGLAGRVRFTGTVSDSDLATAYRGAIALVFPSLYEGFGLPVVEAMACGTPVVTSNTTALPEIAAGAAVLVDPSSIEEIAHALVRVYVDDGLRARLRDAGLARATHFSWSAVAQRATAALADIQ
jgi:glycosyltransferase involved in cell wall biosynthesis